MAQRPQPSLRLADGGSFITRWAQSVMRPNATAKRLREADAPPPPPAAPARAPAPPPPNPNATPDNPAGIRFQDGGHVPGTGRGDKIPAKYEPGEFVVSNDMIDDNPGLREQLSGLRAETLAARGKTVEEADAKALRRDSGGADLPRGGRPQVSLRASDGFFDDLHRGQAAPAARATAQQAANTARNTALPPTPNTIIQGPNGAALPGQQYPGRELAVQGSRGVAPLPPPPAAPSTALVRTADVGNNGYKPNFTMGGDGSPARQMPEGLRPGEAGELSQNARAQAAARAQARATSGLLDEASAATRAASEAARPGAAPGAAPAAAAPSTASKLFGSADDWKNALKGPADSPHKTLRLTAPEAPGKFAKGLGVLQGAMGAKDAYDGIQEGDAWKTGVGAADAVAGAALFTPAAPIAGAYLGVRGAYDTAKAAGGDIYNNLSEGARDVVGGTVNQIGLNTGLWGTDDSAKMQMDAAAPTTLRKTAPGAPTQTRPEDTFAGPPESARSPVGDTVVFGSGQNDVRRIDRPGQSPLFTNVPDNDPLIGNNKLMARGAAPSAQNMAAADNLAARNDITPSLRAQAQYDAEVANAQRINSMQQRMNGAGSRSAQLDLRSPENLAARNASMSSNLDYNRMSRSEIQARTSLAGIEAQKQTAQMQNQTTLRGQDINAETSRYGADASTDASRYGSDSSLRGQMYSSDAQLGAKQMEMQRGLQQQQLKGAIFREAGGKPEVAAQIAASYGLDPKDFTDMASASQTRDHNATTNARKRLEGMAVRSDDKGGTVVDPGRLARLESTLGKMAPGWQHMSEPEQAKHLATAEASVNLIEGLNDRRNNGFWQSIGVDGSSASLDKLPIEAMKGGRLKTVKALEGAFTGGGVEREDYVIETEGGHKLYLPRDKVNQGELELLKSRGVDISSLQK